MQARIKFKLIERLSGQKIVAIIFFIFVKQGWGENNLYYSTGTNGDGVGCPVGYVYIFWGCFGIYL